VCKNVPQPSKVAFPSIPSNIHTLVQGFHEASEATAVVAEGVVAEGVVAEGRAGHRGTARASLSILSVRSAMSQAAVGKAVALAAADMRDSWASSPSHSTSLHDTHILETSVS
jgi:hypothetical protein